MSNFREREKNVVMKRICRGGPHPFRLRRFYRIYLRGIAPRSGEPAPNCRPAHRLRPPRGGWDNARRGGGKLPGEQGRASQRGTVGSRFGSLSLRPVSLPNSKEMGHYSISPRGMCGRHSGYKLCVHDHSSRRIPAHTFCVCYVGLLFTSFSSKKEVNRRKWI